MPNGDLRNLLPTTIKRTFSPTDWDYFNKRTPSPIISPGQTGLITGTFPVEEPILPTLPITPEPEPPMISPGREMMLGAEPIPKPVPITVSAEDQAFIATLTPEQQAQANQLITAGDTTGLQSMLGQLKAAMIPVEGKPLITEPTAPVPAPTPPPPPVEIRPTRVEPSEVNIENIRNFSTSLMSYYNDIATGKVVDPIYTRLYNDALARTGDDITAKTEAAKTMLKEELAAAGWADSGMMVEMMSRLDMEGLERFLEQQSNIRQEFVSAVMENRTVAAKFAAGAANLGLDVEALIDRIGTSDETMDYNWAIFEDDRMRKNQDHTDRLFTDGIIDEAEYFRQTVLNMRNTPAYANLSDQDISIIIASKLQEDGKSYNEIKRITGLDDATLAASGITPTAVEPGAVLPAGAPTAEEAGYYAKENWMTSWTQNMRDEYNILTAEQQEEVDAVAATATNQQVIADKIASYTGVEFPLVTKTIAGIEVENYDDYLTGGAQANVATTFDSYAATGISDREAVTRVLGESGGEEGVLANYTTQRLEDIGGGSLDDPTTLQNLWAQRGTLTTFERAYLDSKYTPGSIENPVVISNTVRHSTNDADGSGDNRTYAEFYDANGNIISRTYNESDIAGTTGTRTVPQWGDSEGTTNLLGDDPTYKADEGSTGALKEGTYISYNGVVFKVGSSKNIGHGTLRDERVVFLEVVDPKTGQPISAVPGFWFNGDPAFINDRVNQAKQQPAY